jgi:hypothetical protein
VILFAIGTEELLAHPEVALDDPTRWASVGGVMLFLASLSVMVRLFTHQVAWSVRYRPAGHCRTRLGDPSAAALGTTACVALVATLSVETARHQEELSQIR